MPQYLVSCWNKLIFNNRNDRMYVFIHFSRQNKNYLHGFSWKALLRWVCLIIRGAQQNKDEVPFANTSIWRLQVALSGQNLRSGPWTLDQQKLVSANSAIRVLSVVSLTWQVFRYLQTADLLAPNHSRNETVSYELKTHGTGYIECTKLIAVFLMRNVSADFLLVQSGSVCQGTQWNAFRGWNGWQFFVAKMSSPLSLSEVGVRGISRFSQFLANKVQLWLLGAKEHVFNNPGFDFRHN